MMVRIAERTQQHRLNASMLEATTARNDEGQVFTPAELAAKSTANKAIRRADLMTRIAGFERYADAESHQGVFITLTCPNLGSRFKSAPCPLHQCTHARVFCQRMNVQILECGLINFLGPIHGSSQCCSEVDFGRIGVAKQTLHISPITEQHAVGLHAACHGIVQVAQSCLQ
ncbi:replication endonuclease [Roseateles sp. DAIF2]|nr:replication endonuclease [Roseateles sp. DAIF2]